MPSVAQTSMPIRPVHPAQAAVSAPASADKGPSFSDVMASTDVQKDSKADPADTTPDPAKAGTVPVKSQSATKSDAPEATDPVTPAKKKAADPTSDAAAAALVLQQIVAATTPVAATSDVNADVTASVPSLTATDAAGVAARAATGPMTAPTSPTVTIDPALIPAADPTATDNASSAMAFGPADVVDVAQAAISALLGPGKTADTAQTQTAAAATDTAVEKPIVSQPDVVSVVGVVDDTPVTSPKISGTAGAVVAAIAAAAKDAPGQATTAETQASDTKVAAAAQVANATAQSVLRQVSSDKPMSRMAEIRSRLQVAQTGALKTAAKTSTLSGVLRSAQDIPVDASAPIIDPKSIAAAISPKQATAPVVEQLNADLAKTEAAIDPAAGTMTDQSSFADLLTTTTKTSALTTATQTGPTQQAVPLSAVAQTLISHAKARDSEFSIRLDPAELGRIDVKMKVNSNGEVRAHLIVERTETLDLLTRDQRGLQQTLDQAGFKTDSSGLQFSLRDQGSNSQNQQGWRNYQANQTDANAKVTDPAVATVDAATIGSLTSARPGGIDLNV